jgi:hypothetical protein
MRVASGSSKCRSTRFDNTSQCLGRAGIISDIKELTPHLAVSGQITVSDLAAIEQADFRSLIVNPSRAPRHRGSWLRFSTCGQAYEMACKYFE